jgi:hypothetical protein
MQILVLSIVIDIREAIYDNTIICDYRFIHWV